MRYLFTWLMRTLLAPMSVWLLASAWSGSEGFAQSSSLFRRVDANPASLAVRPAGDLEEPSPTANVSYFSVKPLPKRIYKVGDLLTVIVRQKSQYKHDGKTDVKSEENYKVQLKDWIRLHNDNLIPDSQPFGDPTINAVSGRGFKGDGKMNRTSEVITRITCRIIDIMPNGNLVLQGGPDVIETDGEKQTITVTGTCRREDILADNTILSTQINEFHFTTNNGGAVRDAMKRGWLYRAWDLVKPF
jgi:flagellar L-ring protein FlgH